jgi:hypothetical protein
VIQRFFRFEGVDGAKWSMNASACAIRTMRISTTALGRVVSSAVSFGRHEITKGTRKTRSIGPNIERWWKGNEVEIPGTKNARQKAFLDALLQKSLLATKTNEWSGKNLCETFSGL